uniref:Reverse transcriptase domain-containing protein n=1 Tax=Neogobius melanostomus TaxID=47308 RepID=A0A8C6WYS4_9GOBI
MDLQTKLDQLYLNRAHGAFVRSRAKWIEAGEKNSSYFFNLEKSRQKRNCISCLLIDGKECKDFKLLENEVFQFYSKLYSTQFSKTDCNNFFDKISHLIPQIEKTYYDFCEADLKIEELDTALKKMILNKSPGSDGLTVNFYKFFWEEVREILFKALLECISQKELMTTMKQGVITLIPKPGKDKRQLDNLRPITLLNTDYKIFSGSIAARLKQGISNLISETQSGFLKDRLIHNNIRLVLDLIDYRDLIEENSFILFLDFYKAFDSVEHPFILETLNHFGFGENFRSTIGMLYHNINSSVLLGHGSCTRFNIKRGIRQGCGSSPLLFIMAAEMLSISLKNSDISGIDIMGEQIIISQLADDTTLFLKNEDQIPLALQTITDFTKASGLHLNLNKCELFALNDHPQQLLYNIKIKKEVKYLGITITKDKNISDKVNVWDNINKCKLTLNRWLQRDISIFGRILLTKMDSLSRLIYPAYSLPITQKMIKATNNIHFNFIWRNKCHYISKDDMIKSYQDGGGNAIDFDTMNGILKLKWLKTWLNNIHSIWYFIPNMLFNKMGGIHFLLKCDFEMSKLPVKLSDFHQQVLLYWKLIFKHNFTPHNSPIWNNRYITINRKSVYFDEWFSQGVWAVAHFLNDDGCILQYEGFCEKFQIHCTKRKYNQLVKAIPLSVRSMVKQDIFYSNTSPKLRHLWIEGSDFCDPKCNNKFLRCYLLNCSYPNSIKRSYILKDYKKEEIIRIRTKYLSFPIPFKMKEIQFKILNKIYPTNEFIKHRFKIETGKCIFCNTENEDLDHLFYSCNVIQSFWQDFQRWLQSKGIQFATLTTNEIKFGIKVKNIFMDFGINNLLLLCKYFIHKCRFFKTKPTIFHWKNELNLFSKSIQLIEQKSAKMLETFLLDFGLLD